MCLFFREIFVHIPNSQAAHRDNIAVAKLASWRRLNYFLLSVKLNVTLILVYPHRLRLTSDESGYLMAQI
jgi:hypothetical protein